LEKTIAPYIKAETLRELSPITRIKRGIQAFVAHGGYIVIIMSLFNIPSVPGPAYLDDV
jgi:hypothetical protein